MIDAHTHLNLDVNNPVAEYVDSLKKSSVDASVLILNSQEEMKCFWNNAESILNNNLVHVAFLLDINNLDFFEQSVGLAKERGLSYSIKLHPRLTDITENDFETIYAYIRNLDFRSIIIDSFLCGSKKENICYIELSTYLARKIADKNIVMAHFGGIKVLETMLRTRELHNIYYDSSFSINYLNGTSAWMDLRHCIIHSSDRVLFGSDRPSFTVDESIHTVRELIGEQSEQFYKGIFSNNARRLYFD